MLNVYLNHQQPFHKFLIKFITKHKNLSADKEDIVLGKFIYNIMNIISSRKSNISQLKIIFMIKLDGIEIL